MKQNLLFRLYNQSLSSALLIGNCTAILPIMIADVTQSWAG